jgi:enterochelin esterase-like enzyme
LKRLLYSAILLMLATGCIGVPPTSEPDPDMLPSPEDSTKSPIIFVTATQTITPSFTPSFTPTCAESYGRVEDESYPGRVIAEQIPVRVYLPPCYSQGDQRYPVLYLLHGSPFDESQWVDLGVEELADSMIGSHKWPPYIIVMPRIPEPLFTGSDGGPGSYEEEFMEGLVPFIEETYRTDVQSVAGALGGISRGGVWALEIALRHPELFDIVTALSPALHVNYARPQYDPFVIVRTSENLPRYIFLSAGDADGPFREKVEEFSGVLDEVEVAYTLVIGSGGHELEAWRAMIEVALNFIVVVWFPEHK